MDEPFDLSDKAGIVTGAGRGLGKAMVKGLASAGARVMATDVDAPEDTVFEINEAGGEATGEPADVTERDQVRHMVEMTEEVYGQVDFLINNAGILRSGAPESMDEADWFDVLEVNLTGQYYCAQETGRVMIESGHGGSIVNIASVAGLQAFAEFLSYNVSKGGSLQLTRSLAGDWADHDIRVNAICPGIFKTGMTEELIETEEMQEMIENRIPMKRHGVPEELAPTAVYLVSEASRYMTGEHIVVDGGWTAEL